jgi:uncharacterized repeat protein (TIGR01451 family)
MSARRLPGFLITFLLLISATGYSQMADLNVTKSGPPVTGAGSDVTFTVIVDNFGPDDAANVVLTDSSSVDPEQPGLTFVSLTQPVGFSCSAPAVGTSGTITCNGAALAAGSSATFTFTMNVPPGTASGSNFTNIASVSNDIPDPDDENNQSVAVTSTPPPPQADLGVQKSGPNSAIPDTDIQYTITLTNAGPAAATNITLTDNLPIPFVSLTQDSGPAFSCTTPAASTPGTITCTAASMPAGNTATFTLIAHVPPGAGGSYTNNVAVTSDNDPNPENNAGTTTVVAESADVSVTKLAPATGTAGLPIDYTLAITNAGPTPANAVALTDALPAGTTFVSINQNSGPTGACSTPPVGTNGTVTCSFSSLASGASASFILRVQLSPTLANGSIVSNTATISSGTADPNPANNSQSASTTVAASADLSVVKSGPATATSGANVVYTIVVANAGPSTAASVQLTDVVPPGTTFVSINQTSGPAYTCGNASGTVTCTIASLPGAMPASFDLTVLNGAGSGTVTNTATVATATPDPNPANNTSSTSANALTSADLAVTKTGPANAGPASLVHYDVTVTNNGPSTAANVTVSDTIPPGSTYASIFNSPAGPAFSCTTPPVGGTGAVICTVATLPNGASGTIQIEVTTSAAGGGTLINSANATATTPDPNPANNTATTSTIIAVGSADLALSKTASSPSVLKNANFSYTITVNNAGPTAAGGVTVTDTLPAGATFVTATPSQGSCTGTTTVICTLGTLASGSTASINLAVQAGATVGAVANTATVSSGTPDPNAANNSSTANVTIVDSIPTLSSLGLALLALALGCIGAMFVRLR